MEQYNQIDFFADEAIKNTKCEYLAKNPTEAIEWENSNATTHSKEVVKNEELITRQIFSPIHVDEAGNITPAAFNDAMNKGLSVNRLNYSSETEIHTAGERKAERDRIHAPERAYLGLVTASVSSIRSLTEGIHRVFAIYDTALSHDISHADVCALRLTADDSQTPALPKTAARLHRRVLLLEIFGKRLKEPPQPKTSA